MKVSLIIVLFSCFTIANCGNGCSWTGCEGILRTGNSVCKEYGRPIYTGRTNGTACSWDTEKVECCKPTPSKPGCKWTEKCYNHVHSGNFRCKEEYGKGYIQNDYYTIRFIICFECCPA